LYRHFEDKAALVARVTLHSLRRSLRRSAKAATLSRRWPAPMCVSRWRTSRTTRPCSVGS
jgi:hypothetical protein